MGVLREETWLPRASANIDRKGLDRKKMIPRANPNSPTSSKGRDSPPKKAKTAGADHKSNYSNDGPIGNPFHWQFYHAKDCPITEDPDSVAHLVRHFKPVGCPLPSLRTMTEDDAYVKMVVANAKV